MPMDRRRLLRSAPPFLLAPSLLSASSLSLIAAPAMAARADGPVALLIPRSGPYAALGLSMERAAMLAQAASGTDPATPRLMVMDTGGTPQGAAAAGNQARKRKAAMILGPLLSAEVPGVVQAAGGQMPVITFSNDANLRESGAFLLGVTARQSVAGILQFAADRGIRSVGVGAGAGDNGWAGQVRLAATSEGERLGLRITSLPADLSSGFGGGYGDTSDGLPDAVLMADAASLVRVSQQLGQQGIQPLGAFAELEVDRSAFAALAGSWLALPDPQDFSAFARDFESRIGTRPGMIAALAYDATKIAMTTAGAATSGRSALLAANGFDGVCGHVRFREDGSASRALAILEIAAAGARKVATVTSG